MKAVAIKGVKSLEVKEVEEPVKNGTDVLVDVRKTGICGSDIHNWDLGAPVGLVMGHEFCGIVTDPGARGDLKVGDRVTALPISPCNECSACLTGNPQYCRQTWTNALGLSLTYPGGLAPKLKVRPDMVIKVPDNLKDEEVAMVEPTAVGLHAVNLAKIKLGDSVLVIGGGIIGLVSAMFAKMAGAGSVVISETNEKRGKKAVKLGVADEWLNALDKDFMTNVMTKTKNGFDVTIECCGNKGAVTSALMATRPGGKIVLVGVSALPIEIPLVIGVTNELTMLGSIAYTKEEFISCVDLMAKKKIDVLKFVDDIVPLEKVQASYERLTSGDDDAIKILVDPNL